MPRPRSNTGLYRIPTFLTHARTVQSKDEARQLCEEELAWIYTTYQSPTMPHKVVNAYRKALREAGLVEPFLQRPVTLVEDGETLTETRYLPGYFRERETHVQDRKMRDTKRLDEALSYDTDVRMLDGHEQAYLQTALGLTSGRDWEETAVGVLMATGRRTIEVCLTAHMRPLSTPYWVSYSGQAKTRSTVRAQEWHELPVLIPEHIVCEALKRVQVAVQRVLNPDAVFDDVIGRKLRHRVEEVLRSLFPTTPQLSPRTLRNCYVAIALEAVTPDGTPLCVGDPEHVLGQLLGHQMTQFRPRDAYKTQMLPRLRRNIVLPE